MSVQLTVILCTYNRCRSLPAALQSVAAQQMPDSLDWEILVVDNNSTDQTRAVVSEFAQRNLPGRIRYLFEPRQGLSNARNAGIREARGELIAFMDDDVTVDPNWLQSLTASLHSGEYTGAGGRILPPQDFQPPQWLTLGGIMDSGGVLALFDLGDQPGELKKAPYGTNMAFRKAAFEKYGGFRADLGRCGDNLIGNEDTEFGGRLLAAGERLRYEPAAVVHHPVSKDRLNKNYFLAWWFAYGRAMVRQIGKRPAVWGIPRHYISIVSRTLRWMITLDPQRRFWWKTKIWMSAGEIAELYSQSRAGAALRPEELSTPVAKQP